MVKKKTVLLTRFFNAQDLLPTLSDPCHKTRSRTGFRTLFLVAALLAATTVLGQQPTIITQYMFTNMATNPAYAGGNGGINLTGLVRSQWMGWKDSDGMKSAPQTYMLMVDSPIRKIHGGVGGSIAQDQIGAFKNTIVKLGYAYRMEALSGNLSFGLAGNLVNIGYDASKFTPIEENDPVLGQLEKASDMMIDVGLGAFYSVPEEYYIGLSVDNLLQTRGKKTNYQLRRTFYLNGGYHFDLPNHPLFEINPSAQILFDGAVFQFNASALLVYNNKFYGGLGYRLNEASVLAGLYVKGIQIGLAYDIGINSMTSYNNGSLEVVLNYCFKIDTDKYKRTYRNTRFL